jgi:hypothetical protein
LFNLGVFYDSCQDRGRCLRSFHFIGVTIEIALELVFVPLDLFAVEIVTQALEKERHKELTKFWRGCFRARLLMPISFPLLSNLQTLFSRCRPGCRSHLPILLLHPHNLPQTQQNHRQCQYPKIQIQNTFTRFSKKVIRKSWRIDSPSYIL